MSKRQFYKLFKAAFTKAFVQPNIKSGWEKTGVRPFNPSIILDQLSIKPATSTSRPTTGSSASHSSISLSDWRKINQVVRAAIGDALNYEGRQILHHCHGLQAENAILKAQIEGLQEAIRVEKKQRKPKKALTLNLRGDDSRDAVFFSPAKICALRREQADKQREIEEAEARKQQQQLEKQQEKERKAETKRIAAIARQEKREQSAREKAEKQAQRDEARTQRLADQQLANGQKSANKKPRKKPQRKQKSAPSRREDNVVIEQQVVEAQDIPTSRSGRRIRAPRRLDDF
jgi:hypothetical protein